MASVQPESDFPHPFQLRFAKEGMDDTVQNRPKSDLDDLVRVWPNASGLEASWCAGIIWPGFWKDAPAPLPVSDLLTQPRSSTDDPNNIVQNQPGPGLVLADCVRFWPNGSGPEASRCTRIVRLASGQCFPPEPDRMRIGSGMFTGTTLVYMYDSMYRCGETVAHVTISPNTGSTSNPWEALTNKHPEWVSCSRLQISVLATPPSLPLLSSS